jgi:SAM-dependent methyltransferase
MPDYGNWIRRRIIYIFLATSALTLLIGLLPIHVILRAAALLAAVTLFGTAVFIIYIYRELSARGGDFQCKLWHFVMEHLHWNGQGRVLDIGTGNGPLAILLAKQHTHARVIGIDYWGSDCEYSQQVCESNAALEGVTEQVSFQKASAANLPFADGEFDAVVSHFVFHEVADAPDKREVIQEALRVLRKGGSFSFQDMFFDESLYGDVDTFINAIKNWGVEEVQIVDTRKILEMPRLLRHPRVFGMTGLICGTK